MPRQPADAPRLRQMLLSGTSAMVLGLVVAAPVAQALYAETAESLAAQAAWQASRAYNAEPAQSIEQGRPTKADRRQLTEWQRWSVSLDDER